MSIVISKTICPQDHSCPAIRICPVAAITQKGFELPRIEKEKCISCLKCIKFCPMGAIREEQNDET